MTEIDNDLLNRFLSDPDVVRQMMQHKRNSVFDITDPIETRQSRWLGWLFDPNEGHGAGDFFIKALLSEVSKPECKVEWHRPEQDQLSSFDQWSLLELHQCSFAAALVSLEFKMPAPDDMSAVDIAIIDPTNQLMVIVENKVGSKEQQGQTKKYAEGILGIVAELGWKAVFVYMDWYENEAEDSRWNSVGYDWLADAIDNCLESGLCNPKAVAILGDYRDYVRGQEESRELAKIAAKHAEFLNAFKEHVYDQDITRHETLISWKGQIDKGHELTSSLYWKHSFLFDVLFEYGPLNKLGMEVQGILGSGWEYETHTSTKYDAVYFHT